MASSPSSEDDGDSTSATVGGLTGRGRPATAQEILLAKRDVICISPPERPTEKSPTDVDILGNEYLLLYPQQKPKQTKQINTSRSTGVSAPVLEPLCVDEQGTDVSDDSAEDEAVEGGAPDTVGRPGILSAGNSKSGGGSKVEKKAVRNRVTLQTGAILLHAPSFGCKKSGRWDANRSSRANQDYQRQDDRKRMTQIMEYLVKLRTTAADQPQHRAVPAKQKEYAGGMYARLEAQFKATHSVTPGANKVPPMNPSVRPKGKFQANSGPAATNSNSAGLPFR